MWFGEIPTLDATGCVLAHSVKGASTGRINKGTTLTDEVLQALFNEGILTLTVARFEAGDVAENEAAQRLGGLFEGLQLTLGPINNGRADLYANHSGVLQIDRRTIDAFNRLDEAIALATLGNGDTVATGQMVVTLKIIPLAVRENSIVQAVNLVSKQSEDAAQLRAPISIAQFRPRPVNVIQTTADHLTDKVLSKTERVMSTRLKKLGCEAQDIRFHRTPHTAHALNRSLAVLGAGLTIVIGATAIVDRRDVIPKAIVEQGGEVIHFGLPVDPGNLLLVGKLKGQPIVGAPGCVRSPVENGFDWVLARLLADLPLDQGDLQSWGVGGLLKEDSDQRLVPRASPPDCLAQPAQASRIAALVLAAGHSKRMGDRDKLQLSLQNGHSILETTLNTIESCTAQFDKLLLLSKPVDQQKARKADCSWDCLAVPQTGETDPPMSLSIKTGIKALNGFDAVLIALGDMPFVAPETIDQIVNAFYPAQGIWAVRPTFEGRAGNPVLVGSRFFAKLLELEGDRGAKTLLDRQSHLVLELPVDDPGILNDIDTPADYERVSTEK